MKKNVKILGAAAAALLAVAPVAASATGVAFANGNGGNNPVVGDNTGTSISTTDLTQKALYGTIKAGKPNFTPAVSASQIQYVYTQDKTKAAEGVSVVGMSTSSKLYLAAADSTSVSGWKKASETQISATDTLQAGQHYIQEFSVELKVPKIDNYTINGITGNNSSEQYTIANVPVDVVLTAQDANIAGQPYFTEANNHVMLTNGAVLPNKVISFNSGESTSKVVSDAKAAVKAWYEDENGSVKALSSDDIEPATDITTQLTNQGVLSDGVVSTSAKSFNVVLKATNPKNGKTATVTVPFSAEVNNNTYPAIWYYPAGDASAAQHSDAKGKHRLVAQGSNLKETVMIPVQQGSKFALTDYLKACNTNSGTATGVTMYNVKNEVNTSVPGVYPVTVRATNGNQKTTYYTAYVVVTPVAGSPVTVQYPANYGVLVWNLSGKNGNTYANAANAHKFVKGQSTVKVMEIATVNGVSYSRIEGQDSNGNSLGSDAWIQTAYLDGSWKQNTNKPSTNNGEEKVSGTATVTYKGKGGVRLLNAEGKYQSQVVKKGSSWKVFAKKTINGTTMYRLGTQNQWIPAGYVNFR